MITKENGDVVLLVRVAPDGIAEQQFMEKWMDIKAKLGITESSLMLGAIFGGRYNQYALDFDNENNLYSACDWLREYFYKMTIENDFDEESVLPEVIMARRRHE